jgi:hypothetical protein
MTALIFPDEVFIERNPSEQSASCEFEFKGHQFYLSHRHEFSLHQNKHHFVCKIDGQHYTFGVARSTLGAGSYGTWPRICIEGNTYRFNVEWARQGDKRGIRFSAITN